MRIGLGQGFPAGVSHWGGGVAGSKLFENVELCGEGVAPRERYLPPSTSTTRFMILWETDQLP